MSYYRCRINTGPGEECTYTKENAAPVAAGNGIQREPQPSTNTVSILERHGAVKNALKSCPFCGCNAELKYGHHGYDHAQTVRAYCPYCHVSISPIYIDSPYTSYHGIPGKNFNKEEAAHEAARIWNRRSHKDYGLMLARAYVDFARQRGLHDADTLDMLNIALDGMRRNEPIVNVYKRIKAATTKINEKGN